MLFLKNVMASLAWGTHGRSRWLLFVLVVVGRGAVPVGAYAQNSDPVVLSFDEPVPVTALLEYIGGELGVSFMYDPALVSGEVELTSTGPLPAEALMGLLGVALRSNELAVVETGTAGVCRIVPMSEAAKLGGKPANAVTGRRYVVRA